MSWLKLAIGNEHAEARVGFRRASRFERWSFTFSRRRGAGGGAW